MKPVLLMLLLSTVTSMADASEVARIRDRKTHREIVYRIDENQLVFNLLQGELNQELNRINFEKNGKLITLHGDQKKYRFNFFKKFLNASKNGYIFCWSSQAWKDEVDPPLAYQGFLAGGVGILFTMPLCAVLPAIPTVIGLPAVPVDSAISLIDALFDPDQVVKRKFDHLIQGRSIPVSNKVFLRLVDQISKL